MPRKTKNEDAAAVTTTAPVKEKATKAKAAVAKVSETRPAEKKTPEKKAPVKKAACKTSVCVEMNGLSVSVTDIQTAVKKAVKEKGLEASELNIYINATERAAYYTIDGEGGEDYKVELNSL